MDLNAKYSLSDGTAVRDSATGGASTPNAASDGAVHGLRLTASGHYKKSPLKIAAKTDGVLILESRGGASARQPLQLDAVIGTAKMSFTGAVTDPLHLTGLQGHFEVAGPFLDAYGAPWLRQSDGPRPDPGVSLRPSCSASMRSRAEAGSYSVAGGQLSQVRLRPAYADRFTTVLQEHIMGKYLLGWVLGVPVIVLVLIYFFMH